MPYQVGSISNLDENDPVFETMAEAVTHARVEGGKWDTPIGIWTSQDEGSKTVAIVYEDRVFTPK